MEGFEGPADRARRPKSSPGRTPKVLAEAVIQMRHQHPAWGGHTISGGNL